MNVVMICLVIAVMLPNLLALATIPVRITQFGKPDINAPREQGTKLTGVGQRLGFAQSNAWEALAVYIATLVLAFVTSVPVDMVAQGSMVFIVARISHAIFYTVNQGVLRFLSWMVGMGSCVWLMVQAFSM